jgi:starch phosphorylase
MTEPSVAYFSAEYAIADDLPIYAGGLGVLAADMVLEAGSQDRDFHAVGLVYHLAFTGDDPDQRDDFAIARDSTGKRLIAKVLIAGRVVALQAWVKRWGRTQLILLDSNLSQNSPTDRAICDRLYAADLNLQLAQEICLRFGGVAMLQLLGVKPDVYHLNEGHTALAGLAVVLETMSRHPALSLEEAVTDVRQRLVGTKHTILAGAGILLDWGSVARQLEPTMIKHGSTIEALKALAGLDNGDYSDTKLLIELTRIASGVSVIHVAEELEDHPTSKLIPITNGVYRWRWAAQNWGKSPLKLDDAEFWSRHCENRHRLFELTRLQAGVTLDPEVLTVVWARRMAAYKRPDLLVSDLHRLIELVSNPTQPIQFVVAGRANPADTVGVELMNRVIAASKHPKLETRFAYLPRYNPVSAKFLVRGADVWLNTPIRGYEACGTSGMKASLNGAVQFSTSDGWVDEVKLSSIGWRLPVDNPATTLYNRLEHEIAPMFYDRDSNGLPHEWIDLMRSNMNMMMQQFTATRMLGDYYAKLYEPSLHQALSD